MNMILAWNVGSIAETLATKIEMIALAAREERLSAAPIGVRASHFLALGFPNQVPSGLLDSSPNEMSLIRYAAHR